jgi:hypothetical protein
MTKRINPDEIDEAFILASVKEQSRKGTIPDKGIVPREQHATSAQAEEDEQTAIIEAAIPQSDVSAEKIPNLLYPLRPSSKQRKVALEEYKRLFLQAPKIEDRKPVFVSRATRESLDKIVRQLGDRKMSVSGLIENLALHHLEAYKDDIEQWRKL